MQPGKYEGWQLVVFSSAALFGGPFWFGFTNFLLGISFAMLVCAELLRPAPRRWLLGFLLLLTFFAHMVPFAFAMLVLLLYMKQSSRRKLSLCTVPSLLFSAWYFIGRFTHGNTDGKAGMLASVPYLTPAFAAFKAATYLKSWGFINPSLGGEDSIMLSAAGAAGFLALLALDVAVALAILWLFVRIARRASSSEPSRLFLWYAIAIFALVAMVMPGAAAGISDPGGRMMQSSLWCGVLLVSARSQRAKAAMAAGSTSLLAVNLYLMIFVVCRPPASGLGSSPFPAEVREFGHVLYAGRWSYYDNITRRQMNRAIYPTALFIEAPATSSTLIPP